MWFIVILKNLFALIRFACFIGVTMFCLFANVEVV